MASINESGWTSKPAAADFSAILWPRLVVENTSGEYALCGLGACPHAVGDGIPRIATGKQVRGSTMPGRIMKIEVGAGGVTRGAKICSDAAGKIVVSVTSGHIVVGIAQEAAAAGEVAAILYMPGSLGVI